MLKLLRYIPLGAIVLALGIGAFAFAPAFAQSVTNIVGGDPFQGEKITRVEGDQLFVTVTATNDSFDFGFTSDFVQICVEADTAVEGAFMRFGHTVDDSTPAFGPAMNMTIVATSDAIFRTGLLSNDIRGRAFRILPGGDGTDTTCNIYPFRTNGITINWADATPVSVDVTAYQTVTQRRR